MMVVYRHCQHTFQYNQLEKVHVPLYDPFKAKHIKKMESTFKNTHGHLNNIKSLVLTQGDFNMFYHV